MNKVILLIFLVIISTISLISWRLGYHEGVSSYVEVCELQKSLLVNRDEQEVIHEILGKYTGSYSDNSTYDYNTINKLFR